MEPIATATLPTTVTIATRAMFLAMRPKALMAEGKKEVPSMAHCKRKGEQEQEQGRTWM
jgi:hypothetical protein